MPDDKKDLSLSALKWIQSCTRMALSVFIVCGVPIFSITKSLGEYLKILFFIVNSP